MAKSSKTARRQKSSPKSSAKAKVKSSGKARSSSRRRAKGAGSRAKAPQGAAANAVLAGKSAAAGTRAGGMAIKLAASKARVPLIMGGAAVAGLAGGLAVLKKRKNSRADGVLDFDKLIAGAQRLGSFGEEMGQLATALQRATQSSD